MVRIKKVLNSSVVLAEDEANAEFILLGKGIGYGKKAGENLETNHEDYQLFIPVQNDKSRQVMDLLDSIPSEILELTRCVVCIAKEKLGTEFNDSVYFVLADHLNFALERYQENMIITNRLSWEIQSFYPKEYAVAQSCLQYVNTAMHIQLPEEEGVNIAFHLVNAQASNNPEYDSARYVKLIGELVNIVRYSLNKDFKKDSIHYLRFITHIRFFVERFFTDKMLADNDNNFYLQQKNSYKKESEIANKVKHYLFEKYKKLITDEEMSFLIIHINRLIRE